MTLIELKKQIDELIEEGVPGDAKVMHWSNDIYDFGELKSFEFNEENGFVSCY